MNKSTVARKSISAILATGATLAAGFLSFAGMFVISPVLGLCLGALGLAVMYEGQVFNEAISAALRRIFDKNHLKRGITQQYLCQEYKRITKEMEIPEGELEGLLPATMPTFLKAYDAQKKYLAEFNSHHHLTKDQKAKKAIAKNTLVQMELDFIRELEHPVLAANDTKEFHIQNVIAFNRQNLLKDINRKKWLIRFSWIFAIGGGISSGFAAFSAIQMGLAAVTATFTGLSIIPGGVLITLAVFAGVGYTFMFYQAMSDIVQQYNGKWKQYLTRRKDIDNPANDESTPKYIARLAGITLVTGLAIFATVATAGTWWYATKQGALLLNLGEKIANTIRNISVPAFGVATLLFNISNAISSIDKISRSDFSGLYNKFKNYLSDLGQKLENAWQAHKARIPILLNPFYFLGNFIATAAESLFFIGHLISMGLMSDRLDGVEPWVSAGLTAGNEAAVDANYLPNEETEHHHSHSPALLKVCLFPVTLTAAGIKMIGVAWDFAFSWDAKASLHRAFPPKEAPWVEKETPEVVTQWVSTNNTLLNMLPANAHHLVNGQEPVPVAGFVNGALFSPTPPAHDQAANDAAIPHPAAGIRANAW